MELFTFLTQEKILPPLIEVKDIDVHFIYSIFGVVNVYMRNLVCLFSTQVCRTNQGEEYKLFWPQQSEFIRMAARFGAKIIPFGAVGEDDVGQVVLDYHDLMKIPYFRAGIAELTDAAVQLRTDIEGEVANQAVHLSIVLPKLPGRSYYFFGKPIETEGRKQELKSTEKAHELYVEVKSEVEKCIAFLKEKR
ncbi:Acyltransferase-like protein [Camellia lanceoleosa]|uniref:Acyltransferase-like protein n=1 Tax=Camellia lanceoleosa TaxID=1840588 RepID=A0ACC0GJC0_9ERIC|nr:Acyltransferase-like protein [Camellia lanceoleosa]